MYSSHVLDSWAFLLSCLSWVLKQGWWWWWKAEGGRWMSHSVRWEPTANSWQLIGGKSCLRLLVDFITHSVCLTLMDVIISSVYSQCQEHQLNREIFRKTYSLSVKLTRKEETSLFYWIWHCCRNKQSFIFCQATCACSHSFIPSSWSDFVLQRMENRRREIFKTLLWVGGGGRWATEKGITLGDREASLHRCTQLRGAIGHRRIETRDTGK